MPPSTASHVNVRANVRAGVPELFLICPGVLDALSGGALSADADSRDAYFGDAHSDDAVTEDAVRSKSLERLVAYASRGLRRSPANDARCTWQGELLAALELNLDLDYASRHASAPLTVLGADPRCARTGTWIHATPVEVEVSARGLALTALGSWPEGAVKKLDAKLQHHFAEEHIEWVRVDGSAFMHWNVLLDATTVTPLAALKMEMQQALPGGPDARVLRRAMTELQMLLHEFAATSAIQQGMPNAVWLWGAGPAESASQPSRELPPLWTNESYARGLYAQYEAASRCAELPSRLDDILGAENVFGKCVVVVRDSLEQLERNWFAPAVRALDAGRLAAVSLFLDGVQARASRSLLRRWFSRPQPLVLPT